MASNRAFKFGPVAIAAAAANIFNPAAGAAGVNAPTGNNYAILRHLRVVNKSGVAVPVSMFIGATGGSAAGTEFAFVTTPVPANSFVDWYGAVRMDIADFLTAVAGTVTTLVVTGEGEIGVA
jgi:hypothetical protein